MTIIPCILSVELEHGCGPCLGCFIPSQSCGCPMGALFCFVPLSELPHSIATAASRLLRRNLALPRRKLQVIQWSRSIASTDWMV
jgi:hypothetical protein